MRTPWLALPILVAGLSLAACEDDPSTPCNCPEESPWVQVELDSVPGQGAELLSIDCEGSDCVASGIAFLAADRGAIPAGYQSLFYERAIDGPWRTKVFSGLQGENHVDLALAGSGAAVIVGYGFEGAQVPYATIYDARTPEPTALSPGSGGLLTVDGDDDFFVAGGVAGVGYLASSQAAGSWNSDTFPASFRNEGGFKDVHVRGDVAVACGFDDGADTLQVILRRTKTEDWEMINRNGLEFGVELRCIALADDGAIYAGGVQLPGGPDARAWASVRSPNGEWTALVLPNAEELGRVNDILLASDGSIYLACSSEYVETNTAHLLRVTEAGAREEISRFGGSLLQLAQTSDGVVYAVGSRRIGTTQDREPVLLRRDP